MRFVYRNFGKISFLGPKNSFQVTLLLRAKGWKMCLVEKLSPVAVQEKM